MTKYLHLLLIFIASTGFASHVSAQSLSGTTKKVGTIVHDVPSKVDKNAQYLFYLSGYIVKAGELRPISPKFGAYEYEAILQTFKQNTFIVINEAREQREDLEPYATKVSDRVRNLLRSGVPPQNITIVGASQGAWMTMLVSTYLRNVDLNFVLIGACAADDGFLNAVDLHGNVLFISEKSDLPARCQRFRLDATGLMDSKEIETNTGEKHGFLFRPMKEWVAPTIEWAREHSRSNSKSLKQVLMVQQRAVEKAEQNKDFATLDRLLSDKYIFTDPNGGVSDKQKLFTDIKNDTSSDQQSIDYDDVQVYIYEKSAIVTNLMTVEGRGKDGKEYKNRYRNTVTWINQHDSWRMAAIHVSRMPR